MASDIGTVTRGRYSPLATDVTKNPERLIALRGLKGATWFVDSRVTGGISGNGLSWGAAKLTLAEAVAAALADDTILVAAGHVEATITTALTFAVAGVSVYGYGQGERRPKFTFTGNVDVNLDASGITLSNLVFESGIDAQTIIIDVNAANCVIEDCAFYEGTSIQWVTGVDINGGASNACDNTVVRRCRFQSIAAGADNAIGIDAVADGVIVEGCYIDGDFADAGLHNPTGNVLTNLTLAGNIIRNRSTGNHAIELVSACTGTAVDNRLFADTPGVVFDTGSLLCGNNTEGHKIDSDSVPSPAGLSGDGWIHVAKTAATLPASTTQNIFVVAGGKVLVRLLTGEVTTVVQAHVCNLSVVFPATTGGSVTLATTLDINAHAAGRLYLVEGDGTALKSDGGALLNAVSDTQMVLSPGTMNITTSATNTGATKWDIWYKPLESGARVTSS